MKTEKIKPYKENFKHSYCRRKRNHDYYGRGIYHIIFKKQESIPPFSKIIGDAAISPGKVGCAHPDYFPLGFAIAKGMKEFVRRYPVIEFQQYSIMPDHLHMIVFKKERDDMHLGDYLGFLKAVIAEVYNGSNNQKYRPQDIFQENYTDKILYRSIKLDTWKRYVSENPHRFAMRKQYPIFFQRKRNLQIDERYYEAYGNLFLFRNPDKSAVRVRSFFTDSQKQKYKKHILHNALEKSVLVSPFISPFEKEIRYEAEEMGAKMILITHERFPERFKPALHDFNLCAEGRLMIISLGKPEGTPLTHEICTEMNELAEKISRL